MTSASDKAMHENFKAAYFGERYKIDWSHLPASIHKLPRSVVDGLILDIISLLYMDTEGHVAYWNPDKVLEHYAGAIHEIRNRLQHDHLVPTERVEI